MKTPRRRTSEGPGASDLDGAVLYVGGAARVLSTTPKAVRGLVARRLIPYRKLGARIVFLRDELMAFLAALDGVPLEAALTNLRARRK